MIRYSLAKLALQSGKLSRRGAIVMAPISDRLGARRAYLAELRRLLREIAVAVNNTVLPIYEYEQRRRLTGDIAELRRLADGSLTAFKAVADVDENTFARLRAIVAQLTGVSSATVRRILDLESIRHTDTFIDEARKAIGIDISAVVQQDDLGDYMRIAIARNTSLIKSLSDETVKRVEQAVVTNAIGGNSAKTLRGVLTDQFGVMDSRAKLIARDQMSKFNSDLNRIRQEQAGVESYDWSTAHDERVRPLHKTLDGQRYDWGQRTGAEDGLPPGQPIQCRCIARAVIEWEGK